MIAFISIKNILLGAFLFVLLGTGSLSGQDRTILRTQSEELGKVHWYRDYDKALAAAKKEKKDIFLLFQEVPGCQTCRNYGHNVLSHPLMVEALENCFIPLAIFNNKGGKDKEILDKYNEPSWNNPVVRIIDAEGENLVDRINRDYSALTLSRRMKEALEKRKVKVPEYLNLLEQELAGSKTSNKEELNFKMYCFWTGEKQLGKLDGVVNVEAGFMNWGEVVKVTYDKSVLDKEELIAYGKTQNFKALEGDQGYRTAQKDVRYYLQQSDYKYLPLSELQKTKINSALGSRMPADKYLSPSQKKWLQSLSGKNKSNQAELYKEPIMKAWDKMRAG
ncbi:MAG: VPGUxxT family thioredoxin-like (seleno)protein, type 2 [Bacteroidota bacterium]